jgi:UDP-N-acetylmuramoyl-L-alanyl-D-glutamate--2,6-diaminopimelate ligase
VLGLTDTEIRGVACHPNQVTGPGFLFVCMDEYLEYNRWHTWRSFLEHLPVLQLAAVVTPQPIEGLGCPQMVTSFPRKALGQSVRLFHGQPDAGLRLYGVTGTNGKTTTTRLLAHLDASRGRGCGSVGTLGVSLAGAIDLPGTYTTPLSPELYGHLAQFKAAGADAVAMEVSSHALALDRVEGLRFEGAILTNVERDHLDFHGTQEAYAEAKRSLFAKVKESGVSVLNRESPYFKAFAQEAAGRVVSFGGEGSGADYEARDLNLTSRSSAFTIVHGTGECRVESQLVGTFQIENVLAAIALLHSLGHPLDELARRLKAFPPVCGRMEQIALPNGCTAIVDYAHNPDGLRHLLDACRPFCKGRLHLVFGCGGDRDKGKRPIMGAIAAEKADVCWVTSDNPRTEAPETIIKDIMEGISPEGGDMQAGLTVHQIVGREAAIRAAFGETQEGDILVVAGKGHEDYQIIGHTRHFFSDQAVLRALRK